MKGKALLKIFVLFLAGMALGAFIMGGYVNRKLHRMHNHRDGKGFAEHMVRMVGVEGAEKDQLLELTSEYGNRLKVIGDSFHMQRIQVLVEMEQEGAAMLNGPAKETFLHHMGRMKQGPPERRVPPQ